MTDELYRTALSKLTEPVDNIILELTCKYYTEKKPKNVVFAELMAMRLVKNKIAVILNLIECVKDAGHVPMPAYESYAVALRSSLN